MKKTLLSIFLLMMLPTASWASGGAIKLDKPNYTFDKATIQRGAKVFANYCLTCHNAKAMRYSRLVDDLGMTEEQVKAEIMYPDGAKPKGLMTVSINPADAKEWFGTIPPDLSVIARARGTSWLYTYLRGFYRDESRPSGWNNHAFPLVAMPNVLASLQGVKDEHGKLIQPGSMDEKAFDQTVSDLVAFLEYLGEPVKLQRLELGKYVLLYLLLFAILSYLLKRAYWRDVH